eukprot:3556698-Amphidinium_carterae.1
MATEHTNGNKHQPKTKTLSVFFLVIISGSTSAYEASPNPPLTLAASEVLHITIKSTAETCPHNVSKSCKKSDKPAPARLTNQNWTVSQGWASA